MFSCFVFFPVMWTTLEQDIILIISSLSPLRAKSPLGDDGSHVITTKSSITKCLSEMVHVVLTRFFFCCPHSTQEWHQEWMNMTTTDFSIWIDLNIADFNHFNSNFLLKCKYMRTALWQFNQVFEFHYNRKYFTHRMMQISRQRLIRIAGMFFFCLAMRKDFLTNAKWKLCFVKYHS